MNTYQIASILNSYACFKGITPANKIIPYTTYPYALVANTDNYGEKGTHWIAMYIPNSHTIEYFDSFGNEPNEEISKFLSNFKTIIKNTVKIQSIFDISCGAHVIYFISQRCNGKSFKHIIQDLTSPYADAMVKLYVYKLYKR